VSMVITKGEERRSARGPRISGFNKIAGL